MKILINTPDISLPGGVANHYKGLSPHWREDVDYFYVGGRKGIPGPLILLYDLIRFTLVCIFKNYDLVVLNPSLGKTALKRDLLFLRLSKILRNKTVIFFHGWNPSMVNQLDQNSASFAKSFNRADHFLVLASSFSIDLKKWGINKPISLTTTKVDESLFNKFELMDKKYNNEILFLARVEEYKGIFIVLEMFENVKKRIHDCRLVIAGSGSRLEDAKNYVNTKQLQDVIFLGHLSGRDLASCFESASIYVFPTFSEGMPTSVLEAMAFGLPIVTRPVGGLVDFFENGKMGYMIESFDPKEFENVTVDLLLNPKEMKAIGAYNYSFSKRSFLSSEVCNKLESILKNV